MMVLIIELYLLVPISVTLTIFQGHSSVNFTWKFLCSYLIKLEVHGIVKYIKEIMNVLPFFFF